MESTESQLVVLCDLMHVGDSIGSVINCAISDKVHNVVEAHGCLCTTLTIETCKKKACYLPFQKAFIKNILMS